MDIVSRLLDLLHQISKYTPLEIFTFVGSFLEEIISPIPSPFVMTSAGSIAQSQGKVLPYIIVLAVIGALGKTIGSWILYLVSDKAEDFILSKFGKLIGISHTEVEKIGKQFTGGIRDWIVLFVLRAIPVMPTSPVSVVAGIIKLNLYTYLSASFAGTIIRNCFFLYFGYFGVATAESLTTKFDSWETIGKLVLGVLLVAGLGYIYYQRKNGAFTTLFSNKKNEK